MTKKATDKAIEAPPLQASPLKMTFSKPTASISQPKIEKLTRMTQHNT